MSELAKGWCLVLSGGGTKGVYHLGVWKALKELELEVSALVGTSIGALGAALLAQGAEDSLEVLLESLSLDSLVALPPHLLRDGRLTLDRKSLPAARELVKTLLEKRGLDTSPLRTFLTQHVDEAAIRASGLDLGLVTINLTDLTPRQVFLDEIPSGQLVDYLMASAAFPGFEPPIIDGKRYLDGGLHDNIPVALARKRGYRKLIVSDVVGLGRNRKPVLEGTVTAFIRSSAKLGGAFDFDPQFLEVYQKVGYLDTLKAFGQLTGEHYFLTLTSPHDPGLEAAAQVLDVPRFQVYEHEELRARVLEHRQRADARLEQLVGDAGPAALAAALVKEGLPVLHGGPYLTWRLIEDLLPGPTGRALRRTLAGLYPPLSLALDYLSRA